LGWQGVPVDGAVNPLYVRIANPNPDVLRGTLTISQRIGSLWRGWAERTLELALVLPPRRSSTYLLPWPLHPGEHTLHLSLRNQAGALAEAELSLTTPMEGLAGYIGPPPGDLPPQPSIPLAPSQLSSDPLLLSPFRDLYLGGFSLPPELRETLPAWKSFLREPSPRSFLEREVFAKALGEIPLTRRPLGIIAAGTLLYLGALYFAVGRLCREGNWRIYLVVSLIAMGGSLLGTAYIPGERAVEAWWEIRDVRAPAYSLYFVALATKEDVEWELPGFWIELLPTEESSWSGRDLTWVFAFGDKRSSLTIAPGRERILWTIAPRGKTPVEERFFVTLEGILTPDGRVLSRESFRRGLRRGLRPVVEKLLDYLSPGDAICLGYRREEGKAYVRHEFTVLLERTEN